MLWCYSVFFFYFDCASWIFTTIWMFKTLCCCSSSRQGDASFSCSTTLMCLWFFWVSCLICDLLLKNIVAVIVLVRINAFPSSLGGIEETAKYTVIHCYSLYVKTLAILCIWCFYFFYIFFSVHYIRSQTKTKLLMEAFFFKSSTIVPLTIFTQHFLDSLEFPQTHSLMPVLLIMWLPSDLTEFNQFTVEKMSNSISHICMFLLTFCGSDSKHDLNLNYQSKLFPTVAITPGAKGSVLVMSPNFIKSLALNLLIRTRLRIVNCR